MSGPIAQRFRDKLAARVFPHPKCTVCGALRLCNREEAQERAHMWQLPEMVLLENTGACNLACRACRMNGPRKGGQGVIKPEDMKTAAGKIADAGIQRVKFFGYGEPFLSPRIGTELGLLKSTNPTCHITLSTNGLLLDTDMKRDAGLLVDTVLFSIHGSSEASVREYKIGGSFEKAYQNMRRFVQYRNERGLRAPEIEWKYVVFRWNDSNALINHSRKLSEKAGVGRLKFYAAHEPQFASFWPIPPQLDLTR